MSICLEKRKYRNYQKRVLPFKNLFINMIQIEFKKKIISTENRRPTPPADAFLMVNKTSMTVRWLPPHPEYMTHIRQYRLDIYQGDVLQRHLTNNRGRNYTLTDFGKKKTKNNCISNYNYM